MSFNIQENHLYQNHTDDYYDEQETIVLGAGRSYDCVFCQRGFTTAQALGGHMNIHRKDRATTTNRPSSNVALKLPTTISNKKLLGEEDCDLQMMSTNTMLHYSTNSCLSTHNLGGSSSFESRFNRLQSGKQGDDSSLRTASRIYDRMIQEHEHGQQEEELDLELRLGHHSW